MEKGSITNLSQVENNFLSVKQDYCIGEGEAAGGLAEVSGNESHDCIGDVVNDEVTSAEEEAGNVGDEVTEKGVSEMNVDELARLIAEAEERGYLRGRNERIEALMGEDDLTGGGEGDGVAGAAGEVMILNNLRKSVWEG